MTATRSGSFPWRFLALAMTTAALVSSAVVAVDIAAAAQHSVRAKHCKTKCRKAKATRYLAGHRFFHFAGYPGVEGTALDLDLCADGTLHASGNTLVYRTDEYDFSFDGHWSVISATRWKTRVAFTTANYQTDHPTPFQNPPPEAGVLRLWIKGRSAAGIIDGGGLFNPPVPPLSRSVLPSGSCPIAGAPAGA
jgi:hypothetical protein